MSKKYPKNVFVQYQGEGDDLFLQAETEVKKIPDDGEVAVYEFKEIKKRITDFKLT